MVCQELYESRKFLDGSAYVSLDNALYTNCVGNMDDETKVILDDQKDDDVNLLPETHYNFLRQWSPTICICMSKI